MQSRIAPWVERISEVLHSIRFRLAVWFMLVLALVLILFSIFVYYREDQAIRATSTARLSDALHQSMVVFRAAFRVGDEEPALSPPEPLLQRISAQEEDALILARPDGDIISTWGEVNEPQASILVSLAIQRNSETPFPYPLLPTGDEEKVRESYLFDASPLRIGDQTVAWVILGRPVDPDGQLPRLRRTLFLAGVVTLLAALGGSYWLADRALRPVKAITQTAQEIGETDLSRRLNLTSRDELGLLASTFDRMLDRLQAAFTRQRQFTADASHELRTPLTIIGLETSRALTAGRGPEDYTRALSVIQTENEFMSRLVNELLTLARMDAGQIKIKTEPLDLSDVALEVVERYSLLAANRNIHLKTGELPEVIIQGDRQYLGQMVGNLVDNAIKYHNKSEGAWVKVETGQQRIGERQRSWVRVSDNGAGIAREHLPHLFDRFYRVDQVRSHNMPISQNGDEKEGSGLGLSIVQWIANVHHGTVTINSEPGKGSTFEIQMDGNPSPSLDGQ